MRIHGRSRIPSKRIRRHKMSVGIDLEQMPAREVVAVDSSKQHAIGQRRRRRRSLVNHPPRTKCIGRRIHPGRSTGSTTIRSGRIIGDGQDRAAAILQQILQRSLPLRREIRIHRHDIHHHLIEVRAAHCVDRSVRCDRRSHIHAGPLRSAWFSGRNRRWRRGPGKRRPRGHKIKKCPRAIHCTSRRSDRNQRSISRDASRIGRAHLHQPRTSDISSKPRIRYRRDPPASARCNRRFRSYPP